MKVLFTGGSGLLGKHLIPLFEAQGWEVVAPRSTEFDIVHPPRIEGIDLVFHAAAYTDVPRAEQERERCYQVNTVGTLRMASVYKDVPFVYVSSEYAGNVTCVYSWTKRQGERYVAKQNPHHLIFRTLFKPRPFPFPKAFSDQYTMGDYVDVIAPMMLDKIMAWDKHTSEMLYLGTGRKTIFDIAKQTVPDVQPMSIHEIVDVCLPKDYV